MTFKADYEIIADGVRITRLITTDRVIIVPTEIDGMRVTGIGPAFLSGCHGTNGRKLVIPSGIRTMDPDALIGTGGIGEIDYDGELTDFMKFHLTSDSDCRLVCRHEGREYGFDFIGKHVMSFPEFDDAVLGLYIRLTPEIAIRRLIDPVGLTEENREKYRKYVSDRIMPRAEQAVSAGDRAAMTSLLSTGIISDTELRRLLERSLRSGRVGMTSILMSEIRKRAE